MAGGRILKKSICQSEEIDQLSWFEEVLFYRLIVNCDDFGIFDGRTKIIKGSLFPLKENVSLKQIENAIMRLATVGLVRAYEVQGRPLLQLPTWSSHQRVRNSRHIYPTPEEAEDFDNSPQSAATRRELPPKSESESKYESKSESETESYVCTELHDCSTAPQDAASRLADVPALILNDGTEWLPDQADVDGWEKVYPAVDVYAEFGRMREWCKSNPKKRKTAKGIRRFVTNWLDGEQNRPRRNHQTAGSRDLRGADAYFAMAQEAQTQ
ncbi:MAG: hypothetical protein E7238_00355 [Sarcina sp.]|nr:hypothetical protein [Sarcina sp.]